MSPPLLAVVPLRAPGAGKTRLAPALDPGQRARLTTAMLGDVVAALRDAAVDEIVVAASGPAAASAAAAIGVPVRLDPPSARSLNDVLEGVTGAAGPDRDVLIVTADLPRLTGADVLTVLDTDAEVVVAPTHGGGTGGLLRRPGTRIRTAYGPGSAHVHARLAMHARASRATVERDGFRHDVDTWTDLVALHEVGVGACTAAVLPVVLGGHAPVG